MNKKQNKHVLMLLNVSYIMNDIVRISEIYQVRVFHVKEVNKMRGSQNKINCQLRRQHRDCFQMFGTEHNFRQQQNWK